MKINFEHRGNFNHIEKFLIKAVRINPIIRLILDKYGKRGVEALAEATPKDTGKTSESWTYEIVKSKEGRYEIVWKNSNVVNNVNVAILLQYGHATGNGGFVKGIDYINPAIQSIFQEMSNEAWEEVRQHGK